MGTNDQSKRESRLEIPERLRLIRALASERHDEWLDGACYLNMEALREQSKTQLPLAA